ncbi:MAG: hypothetical protein J2P27_16280 [Actinobacteria bacterium]|nr:hypothetical protein [Actinomycetota bacterium]
MPAAISSFACCDRCAKLSSIPPVSGDRETTAPPGPKGAIGTTPTPTDPSAVGRGALVARRRLLKAAVSRRIPEAPEISEAQPAAGSTTALGPAPAEDRAALKQADFADLAQQPRSVSGKVLDVSPHVLVLGDQGFEQRFIITPDALAWRGKHLEPAGLRPGDNVVVRLQPGQRDVADRIWANIGRVTGVITERSGGTLIVDEGMTRKPQAITLDPSALGRIQVRFPTLEPGYLIDIIGLREGAELVGLIPATSQPSYPADRPPAAPLVSGHVASAISGSATWHEQRDEPPGVLGVDYPALDPDTRCAEDVAHGGRHGYARLPYLAIGSVLRIRNECTGIDCLVPVTGCAWIARLFNDRCVTCGTSPRGRIVDLTLASFISLGGELERGCFNVTVTIGE